MKKFTIALAIAASAAFVTAASAAPLSSGQSVVTENGIESVRLVCDQNGRCFRTRGGPRVVVQRGYNSYDYGPRERYIDRRGYGYREGGYYDRGPSVGIGVGPGGVGVGFGRW